MTLIIHGYLCVQSPKPRPSQTPAVSNLDMVPSSLGNQMFSTSTNDDDDSQPRRQRHRGLETEDGGEHVSWGVRKSSSQQLTCERRLE